MTALESKATVAILGSGTMGRGIARVAAGAGHQVMLYDIDSAALESAAADIKRYLDRDVEKSRLDAAAADQIFERIEYTSEVAALADAALVVEAIVEDLEAKVALLRQLESQAEPSTIFTTNTSSLSVTAIAGGLDRPDQVAGMHFFNPAPVLPLVEIVAGAETSEEVLATLVATAEAWGKTPVRTASTPGFIVNRVARPFYSEALRVVEEGLASPAEVDEVMTAAGGFRMGPFALMDLVGLDVNLAVSKSVYSQTYHDPRFAPNQIQQELVDAGRLGRKSGRGFYDYTAETAVAVRSVEPASKVDAVIVHGNRASTAGLVDRLREAGVRIDTGFGPAPGIALEGTLLWPSDGRPVSAVDALVPDQDLVALDECVDWSTADAVAIGGGDPAAQANAAAILAAAGLKTLALGDGPGLVVLRIMGQLASVAADAVLKGVASPHAIDIAMKLGTNYPVGPLEWADGYGVARVVSMLDNMADYYGEQRYRPSPLLRRAANSGVGLKEDQ